MIPRTGSPGGAVAWLGPAAALVYGIFIARSAFPADGRLGFTLFDDAMISMRYARNLAEGHGLVWNPGEWVEGYTNPLWTLWMAVIHATGVSDEHASLVVMVSGALLLLATAAVAARIAARVFGSAEVAAATFALVAFNYALMFWTLRGMEVGLLALLTTLALALTLAVEARAEALRPLSAPLLWLCLTLALAETTRPDASVLHLIVMLHVAWTMRGPARIVALSALAATIAVTLGAHLAFSAWYYGAPWPNTYYLKLEGVTLANRLRRGIPALMIVVVRNLLPMLIAVLFLLRHAQRTAVRRPVELFGAALCAQAAYSAYVGGDAWEYMGYTNRYLTTVVPVLSILAAAGLRELSLAGGDPEELLRLVVAGDAWSTPDARSGVACGQPQRRAARHDVVRAPSNGVACRRLVAGGSVVRMGIRHRVPVQDCSATSDEIRDTSRTRVRGRRAGRLGGGQRCPIHRVGGGECFVPVVRYPQCADRADGPPCVRT